MEVSQLPTGMYVLKIITVKREQQVKFIKK
ncbi:T9SS type A sorting domain-containing protein [Kaistella sp.]